MIKTLVALAAAAVSASVCLSGEAANPNPPESLEQTIRRLDSETFDAFNRCADPAQLRRHAGFFARNVEFYHDTGGVTWNRADMLANTRKYACGHYTRELIPGSLAVYPIRDFGAIEQGTHRFCQADTGQCDGLADFAIVWRRTARGWEITRVLSYGHRAAAHEKQP